GWIDCLVKLLFEIDLGGFLQLLPHFVQFCLADHLLDAGLKLARQGAGLSDPKTGDAQSLWQILRSDEHKRHNPDQQQLRHAEVKKHRGAASRAPGQVSATCAWGVMMSDGCHMGNLGPRTTLAAYGSTRTSGSASFSPACSGRMNGVGSSRPAARNSSRPGSSFRLSSPKWTRKPGVVTQRSGRPGPARRPLGRTQPASINVSIVPLPRATPRICSISARVTGWC